MIDVGVHYNMAQVGDLIVTCNEWLEKDGENRQSATVVAYLKFGASTA